MALHLRPIGPLPAATYWRRRAIAALPALLLVVLLAQCGGDSPDSLDTATAGGLTSTVVSPSPSPAALPAPSPRPTLAAVGETTAQPAPTRAASAAADRQRPAGSSDPTAPVCPDASLNVVATADRGSYPLGSRPRLRLSVRNTAATPCRRELGQGAVELAVVSGGVRIWSSDDCAPGGPLGERVLAPGEAEAVVVRWPGRRSVQGCPPAAAPAGAGTYRLVARVGTFRRPGAVFRLVE